LGMLQLVNQIYKSIHIKLFSDKSFFIYFYKKM
jgi:hypothetical protein